MSLLEKIKLDSIAARKAKSEMSAFLVTLYAEATKIGKDNGNRESTDEEVFRVLKKFKDSAQELISLASEKNKELVNKTKFELLELEKYLPKLLTEEELKVIIEDANHIIGAKTSKDIGKIMKFLKENHSGFFDGSLASKIIKDLLK